MPPNFYCWAKLNAKFGQNIKILGNFDVLKKYLYLCENYVMLGPEIFFDMSGKILMFSLPVRANYTVPPKQD